MQKTFTNALSEAVSKHITLSPTRQETLAWLAFLVMQHGTICLWRLAAHVATKAQTDSVRRRFYRFFQHVRLDGTVAARLVVDLLGLAGKPWTLAIDRTNWDFGKTPINILMVSVIWNGMGIPLVWTLLPNEGNSKMGTRVRLLNRLKNTFPDMRIASIMGDREFIGDRWMAYLVRENIPFILRLRENQYVRRKGHETQSIADIAKRLRRKDKMIIKGLCRLGRSARAPEVRLVIMRLQSGELLTLACSSNPRRALEAYRHRWKIETMFANLKTKGFNMEDTHLTDRAKLSTLLVVLALAVSLSVKTGVAASKARPIPIKKHGRKAWSLFALGLGSLRKIFAVLSTSADKLLLFLKYLLSPKPLSHRLFPAGV